MLEELREAQRETYQREHASGSHQRSFLPCMRIDQEPGSTFCSSVPAPVARWITCALDTTMPAACGAIRSAPAAPRGWASAARPRGTYA